MSRKLGYDLSKRSVLFPKNIRDEHDKVQQLTRIKYDPVMSEKIKNICPELERTYSFADANYQIHPPRDFNDFIEEGTRLLHCVCTNGYYRGHVAHISYIFFLRRREDPDTPFYTIEIDPNSHRIRRCQGYRHKSSTKEIQAFTEKWQTYLRGKGAARKAA